MLTAFAALSADRRSNPMGSCSLTRLLLSALLYTQLINGGDTRTRAMQQRDLLFEARLSSVTKPSERARSRARALHRLRQRNTSLRATASADSKSSKDEQRRLLLPLLISRGCDCLRADSSVALRCVSVVAAPVTAHLAQPSPLPQPFSSASAHAVSLSRALDGSLFFLCRVEGH